MERKAVVGCARQTIRLVVIGAGLLGPARPAGAEPALVVESRISLPAVSGRIDHMAVDLARKRLFVAELGNDSLDVVDLAAGRQLQRITGLAEPQGVGYAPKADLVAVANGGDGSVRLYRGSGLAPAGVVALGRDADDVRIDPIAGDIVVGYGSGGLAVIDPDKDSKIGDVRLAAHPEGFAVDIAGRAYVNAPDARQIAIVDLRAGRQVAAWTAPGLRANFPIALDASGATLATVFRSPPKLVVIDARTGVSTARLDTCGDADDVFFDNKRRRVYVSCGAGFVDVFQAGTSGAYALLSRIATASGARTALFAPELDRLFVAVRAGWLGADAAIIVLRPPP